MDKHELLKPRFVGARFDDAELPLETLRDLAVLQEMIVEIARWKYREAHPDRQRVPRGFATQVELRLTALEDGSAVPVLIAVFVGAGLPRTGVEPDCKYIIEAPSALVAAIAAVNEGLDPTEHLPKKVLSYFDRFGRSLRPEEAIEFTVAGSDKRVRFDQQSRRQLIRKSAAPEYSDEVRLCGRISEADQHKMSFNVMLRDGALVQAPLPVSQLDTILEAFSAFGDGARIELRGVARKNPSGRVVAVEEVHHIDLLDPLDVSAQLDDFRVLRDGWFDGRGTAPPQEGLGWLTEWFAQRIPVSRTQPRLYPTAEGGVRVEWMFGREDVSLDIDLARRHADWHRLNLDSDEDDERSLDLSNDQDVKWLVERLSTLEGPEEP